MKLVLHPSQALKMRCEEETVFDASLKSLVDQMTTVMYENGGVGLAAPQLAVSKRVIVVDPSAGEKSTDFLAMVNPKFTPSDGTKNAVEEEGCLSLPGVRVKVSRFEEIDVEYQDMSGACIKRQMSGFIARIVQHEVDHLNGKTLLDKGRQ